MQHNNVNIKTVRSNRNTIAIEINSNGILVRAPYFMNNEKIAEFVDKKKAWIEKHIKKINAQQNSSEKIVPYTIEEIHILKDKALHTIPDKVEHYASLIGVDYGRITIRNQRSRWGSCSGAGNLNFNCLLMEFPDKIIDSVIVHELCHRKHMNHSQEFYKEIEKVFPEYKECHEWLKKNGEAVIKRLP